MTRQLGLVAAALIAFAGNSLLCRLTLRDTSTDPASFTALRLASGALVLWALCRARGIGLGGSWASAAALGVYAVAFSFAYVGLSAGTGALLLFGAVQATMVGRALATGERLAAPQWLGLAMAAAGLVTLLLPGLSAPPALGAGLMLLAGVAWGVYTIRGRGTGDPTGATAGNFVRALPLAAVLAAVLARRLDGTGALLAILSGALASGLGYAVWYATLPGMSATAAAAVQLSVPALAALGAVAVLHEALTPRLVLCSAAILGGIALVMVAKTARRP